MVAPDLRIILAVKTFHSRSIAGPNMLSEEATDPGGKQRNQALRFQVLHRRRAHFEHFFLRIGLMGERDRDHVAGGTFVEPGQKGARQDAVVRTAAPDQVGQDHAIDQTMRMVRHQNDRAARSGIRAS
jgi:hypothetical protein